MMNAVAERARSLRDLGFSIGYASDVPADAEKVTRFYDDAEKAWKHVFCFTMPEQHMAFFVLRKEGSIRA